jgi:hypothetical protein
LKIKWKKGNLLSKEKEQISQTIKLEEIEIKFRKLEGLYKSTWYPQSDTNNNFIITAVIYLSHPITKLELMKHVNVCI